MAGSTVCPRCPVEHIDMQIPFMSDSTLKITILWDCSCITCPLVLHLTWLEFHLKTCRFATGCNDHIGTVFGFLIVPLFISTIPNCAEKNLQCSVLCDRCTNSEAIPMQAPTMHFVMSELGEVCVTTFVWEWGVSRQFPCSEPNGGDVGDGGVTSVDVHIRASTELRRSCTTKTPSTLSCRSANAQWDVATFKKEITKRWHRD